MDRGSTRRSPGQPHLGVAAGEGAGAYPGGLEAEVTELPGRARYQRRAAVDGPAAYRNGCGRPRRLTTPLGNRTLRRPRVSGLEEQFQARVLSLFPRRTRGWRSFCPTSTCTACPRATSTWFCGGCWQRRHPSGPSPWLA